MIVKKDLAIKFVTDWRAELVQAKSEVNMALFDITIQNLMTAETDDFNLCKIVTALTLGYAGAAIAGLKL